MLLYKTISLMENIRYYTVDEKGQLLPGAIQGSSNAERSELKIVSLRPSVTEKCQSLLHLEEKEK